MDKERLEYWVEHCPLQEMRIEDEQRVFLFGKRYMRVKWYITFQPSWDSSPTTFEEVRLQDLLALIQTIYPTLYVWLASRFS